MRKFSELFEGALNERPVIERHHFQKMRLLLCLFLVRYRSGAAAAIGDACRVVGEPCISHSGGSDGDVVVVHGRQLRRVQQADVRCNSAKVCVDTTNKVEISTGIWMPLISLGTWFA